MRDTYTQDEATQALGNITRRTLHNWLWAEGMLEPGKRIKTLTRAEVELLASRHHREVIDIDTRKDLLQEISQLQEQLAHLEARLQGQVAHLETRMLQFEGQLQTLTSLLGSRLVLEEKADEQKG